MHLLGSPSLADMIILAYLLKKVINFQNQTLLTLINSTQFEIGLLSLFLRLRPFLFGNIGSLYLIHPHLRSSSLLTALIQRNKLLIPLLIE